MLSITHFIINNGVIILRYPLLYATYPHLLIKFFVSPLHFFSSHLLLRYFTQFPLKPTLYSQVTNLIQHTNSPKSSNLRFLFPGTTQNSLNFIETNQNLIHLVFFRFAIPSDWLVLLLTMTFLNRIVEDETNKFLFNHTNLNGKINIKMITLKKLVRESINSPPLF